ncbi:fimbrial protein [uncultured Dysgonomonas sp.]|uniref:Uncharacterized protein n=1 Tax=uncultured Dysgonomonas sp. TaxID=206096 RepID=A0A212K5L3_9BACT|nr:fimbrial protein [uncultured Dysgonomonas sp.]SBW06795.1 conserved exported hypothetical protein [uncultured Dysgonomonas sp.]
MKRIVYISLLLSLFFVACSNEETTDTALENNKIELSFSIDNYITKQTKAVDAGTVEEQRIDDLYLFLFPSTGSQTLKKYYINTSTFTGGSWNSSDSKVSLNLTQAEAGSRQVYIIANCSSIKSDLDAVVSLTGLQSVLKETSLPWSDNITTPILMSGNKTHDFYSNFQLNNIPLIRAVAKVQLNVKLSAEHQSSPLFNSIAQYNYKFIDFDKNTYALKQASKSDNLVSSSDWVAWQANGTVSSYNLENGKVTELIVTTYINERDNAGSAIEISIPYLGAGPLPPPEFGNETYKLLLPAKIERNHWYIYDMEI